MSRITKIQWGSTCYLQIFKTLSVKRNSLKKAQQILFFQVSAVGQYLRKYEKDTCTKLAPMLICFR